MSVHNRSHMTKQRNLVYEHTRLQSLHNVIDLMQTVVTYMHQVVRI